MKIIKAAGGVLYNKNRSPQTILLIKRNGVWDLPKGKLEEGESIEECSAREVAEEVGVPLPNIQNFIGETYHEYEINGEVVGKKTYWFSMETDQYENLKPQLEEGITDLEWVTTSEAVNRVGYQNLADVLKKYMET